MLDPLAVFRLEPQTNISYLIALQSCAQDRYLRLVKVVWRFSCQTPIDPVTPPVSTVLSVVTARNVSILSTLAISAGFMFAPQRKS